MIELTQENINPALLSPLTLAFIGDGVFDLMVRRYLVNMGNRPVGELNKAKVSMVNCRSQASAVNKILPCLTPRELSVYKRGRNASPKCTPKNGTVGEYHCATGLEALFGYLYLKGDSKRLEALFEAIIS